MYPKFRKTKPQIPSIIDYLGKINNSHISHDSHICHSSSLIKAVINGKDESKGR